MKKGKDSTTPEGYVAPKERQKQAERKCAYKKKHRTTQRPGRTERLTGDVQRKYTEIAKVSLRVLALNRVAVKASTENKQLKFACFKFNIN